MKQESVDGLRSIIRRLPVEMFWGNRVGYQIAESVGSTREPRGKQRVLTGKTICRPL